jgi:hypothetical protein
MVRIRTSDSTVITKIYSIVNSPETKEWSLDVLGVQRKIG